MASARSNGTARLPTSAGTPNEPEFPPSPPEGRAEWNVLDEVASFIASPERVLAELARVTNQQPDHGAAERIDRELADVAKKRTRLAELYMREMLPIESLDESAKGLDARQRALEGQRLALTRDDDGVDLDRVAAGDPVLSRQVVRED